MIPPMHSLASTIGVLRANASLLIANIHMNFDEILDPTAELFTHLIIYTASKSTVGNPFEMAESTDGDPPTHTS